jgi:hypothetical protein
MIARNSCNSALRAWGVAFVFCATAPAWLQAQVRSARPHPTEVVPFHGQYCASVGPQGWRVVAENPQRSAFGADFSAADGKAQGGYQIFPGGALNPLPGAQTPEGAVAITLSGFGAQQVRFGQRHQLERNVYEVFYTAQQAEGVAYYQVIPEPQGFMIVLRIAYTYLGGWGQRGAEASAVMRSLRCNVPYVPPPADPPSLNSKRAASQAGDGDSQYNTWLEKEYYHDPQTGENYWVSPSEDWDQNGPEGPGYYARRGNQEVKLQPGYAQ